MAYDRLQYEKQAPPRRVAWLQTLRDLMCYRNYFRLCNRKRTLCLFAKFTSKCGHLCTFVWRPKVGILTPFSIAGSDSTSGALRTISHFLIRHPKKMAKLTRDLDTAFDEGILSRPVQYYQAIRLPYLKAVIREVLRIIPSFGVPMLRYAPAAGLDIPGCRVPLGTKLGLISCNVVVDTTELQQDSYERHGTSVRQKRFR
ncbi:MAG: cytochrome P450 [Hymenobacter sp.]|nr:MAG: cytochrome P450 [Hymenobacter sp.]